MHGKSSFLAASRHPCKPRGKGIKVQFNIDMYKPLQDLHLYPVIVFNVGNDSYSLGCCLIDCTSEIRMHFIDRLAPLDFWVLAYMNSIYWLSTLSLRFLRVFFPVLCECPWVVCMFELIHNHIYSRALWQKQWGARLKDPRCGMTETLSTAKLFSLGCAKMQYCILLLIGALVELYTKRNHIFCFFMYPIEKATRGSHHYVI